MGATGRWELAARVRFRAQPAEEVSNWSLAGAAECRRPPLFFQQRGDRHAEATDDQGRPVRRRPGCTVTPFTTDDVRVILDVANEMNENVPALKREWDRNNMVFLGATGVDTYHLFTKAPVNAYADLKGRKISAPGSIGLWLKGSGAVPVDGSLTSYYTDIQSGVSDGTVSISTGILPNKIYEVAPYITKVNIGALYIGGMAMNKDSYAKLPPEVQKIVKDVGKEYSRALGETLMQRYEGALKTMAEVGAKQAVPVKISELSAAERTTWVKTMPNLAADWVKANAAKGPAKDIVSTYMNELRKRGVKPVRDWDKEM
ncbi:MAG: TRAP transporter substrate-binding protein DctP [Burkholderiaceae bacterium]|nr:TRAP transporter substrate-binding protein DctP [Burkholderiaceae bacterium]